MFYMVRLCKGYVYICKKCVTMRSTMQEVMQYMKIMFASLGCDKNLVDTENMLGEYQHDT